MSKKVKISPVRISPEKCKGCTLCVKFCPRGCIRMSEEYNAMGYHYAEFVEGEKSCTLCGNCALVCPDVAIEIVKEE